MLKKVAVIPALEDDDASEPIEVPKSAQQTTSATVKQLKSKKNTPESTVHAIAAPGEGSAKVEKKAVIDNSAKPKKQKLSHEDSETSSSATLLTADQPKKKKDAPVQNEPPIPAVNAPEVSSDIAGSEPSKKQRKSKKIAEVVAQVPTAVADDAASTEDVKTEACTATEDTDAGGPKSDNGEANGPSDAAIEAADAENEVEESKKRAADPTRVKRTVFVGNLPADVKEKVCRCVLEVF